MSWMTFGMVAFAVMGFLANAVPAQTADTQPTGGELLQNKTSLAGYGAETYRIVSQPDEIVSVLRNGAVVICKRVASPVAAVRGYVYTGGVYEGQWLGGGLSHLLEHLVAGGSSERRTEAENKALLQKIGNDSNAYTTYDHTAYFVNTTTLHFSDAVDLVTGWMLGALITDNEYKREYLVVQRELERNKGDPGRVFGEMIESNRYHVSPARVPVIGYQEVIQGLKREDVVNYYKMAYEPNNMVFSVAGDMDPEEMLKTVRQFVADAKPGRAFSRNIAPEPPVLAPRTMVATFPKLGQAHLDIAFPSVRVTDPDMYPLDLLAEILGGGESSILVEQIRDEKQLCSMIAAGDDTPSYAEGSFEIFADVDGDKIAPATAAILAEIEKIKSNGVDADRILRAKAQMKIARLKSMQTSQDVAASLATDFMGMGDDHFSDRYVDRIAAVTADQIQAAAKKYLDPEKLLTTVLLPREMVGADGLPKAEELLRAPASSSTQPSEVQAGDSQITRTVLDNGLIVLHRRIATTPLVQISMYALGGLTAEDADSNGLGNLAMSLLPRGTATHSAQQIADFFDLTGGDLSTACNRNTWSWTVSCTKDDFAKTMDVYADVVSHPAFAADQVDPIKSRVLAGIASQDAAWDGQAFRYFNQQFFGPMNSPYQFQAIGNEKNVNRFGPADIQKWYVEKVLPAPRVLAVFGDIDNDAAVAAAREYFGTGKIASPVPSVPQVLPVGEPATRPTVVVDRVMVQKTQQEVAGVVIGFDSQSVVGQTTQADLIVAQCLSGGYGYPTGYIFEILRNRGWVYEAASSQIIGRSAELPGCFIAYAGCDPARVNDVTDIMLQSIARLQGTDADIMPDWFGRCASLIDTGHAMQSELPSDQATVAATEELFGLGYNYHEGFADRINAVKITDVQAIARQLLSHCVVTVCTPDPDSVKIAPGPHAYDSFLSVDLTPRGVQLDVGGK